MECPDSNYLSLAFYFPGNVMPFNHIPVIRNYPGKFPSDWERWKSPDLHTRITLAPLRLSSRAASLPRPDVAPVMITVFPDRLQTKYLSLPCRRETSPGLTLTDRTLDEPGEREVEEAGDCEEQGTKTAVTRS